MSDASDRTPTADDPTDPDGTSPVPRDGGPDLTEPDESGPDGAEPNGAESARGESPEVSGERADRSGTAGAAVDRSPARTSAGVAAVLAAVAALWLPSLAGRALGLAGAALVAVGAVRGRRPWVTAGAVSLLVGVAATGLGTAPVVPLVGATLCTLLAWDAGRYGITVGEQLGHEASTTRLELAHLAATAAVGTAAALAGAATYATLDGGTDPIAVVVLFAGVALLLSALR